MNKTIINIAIVLMLIFMVANLFYHIGQFTARVSAIEEPVKEHTIFDVCGNKDFRYLIEYEKKSENKSFYIDQLGEYHEGKVKHFQGYSTCILVKVVE